MRALLRFGIKTVEIAGNGVEVVNRYREAPWDVILMDGQMPLKNGYDATQEIRELEKTTGGHVPIIAMTANAMVGDKEKCLRAGMDEYISKPISLDELIDILGQWICFKEFMPVSDIPQVAIEELEEQPVDLSLIRTFTEGDVGIERELMAVFVDQSDENRATLAQYETLGNSSEWHEAAHMFKGSAASIGANILAALCSKAQHFEGSAAEQAALFNAIDAEYARVKVSLSAMGLWERSEKSSDISG